MCLAILQVKERNLLMLGVALRKLKECRRDRLSRCLYPIDCLQKAFLKHSFL